ncbi:MAG: DUF302 domain-containing protein [Paracoccaceae bacterium]
MYTIDRALKDVSFAEAEERARAALASKGFGVLTTIDVRATLKKKIGAEIDDYTILGACNPNMAHKALQMEPRVGAMLPCNVILRRTGPETVEVSAIDPVASMTAIDNDELKAVAGEVRELLRSAVAAI